MSSTHLRKYERTFFKDTSVSNLAQIAAGTATVTIYKQGATVASGTTVTTAVGGVAVSVRHSGRIILNDTVQLGTTAASQMLCTEVTSETSLKLQSTTGSSISVAAGDRLVIYSALPTLYPENTAAASSTANPTTTSATGLVSVYLTEPIIDVIVSGTGITTALYQNEESGNVIRQVATDNGDTSPTFTNLSSAEVQRFATTLTANRTITLSTTNATPGAHFRVIRTGLGNFTLDVGGLYTIPALTSGFVDVTYDGAAWRLTAVGLVPITTVGLVSADRGDTSQTLVYTTDNEIQRWATTLTANRTVTLSATNAVNGARFRIVRTGLGAFTLDVDGLKTIASATAAFVDVAHNGTAWVLVAYGALA
jgi:hypothetical protein